MQTIAPIVPLVPQGAPPADGPAGHHTDPLHDLDVAVESAVGADLRLLYGMLVPVLLVVGLILALVIGRTYWLVAAALIPEIALLLFIVVKILAMLDEPDPDRASTGGVG